MGNSYHVTNNGDNENNLQVQIKPSFQSQFGEYVLTPCHEKLIVPCCENFMLPFGFFIIILFVFCVVLFCLYLLCIIIFSLTILFTASVNYTMIFLFGAKTFNENFAACTDRTYADGCYNKTSIYCL